MEPMPFRFKGEIVGDEEIKKILSSAPAIIKTYMRKYFRYAGNTFIGSKKKPGAVRQAIYSIKRKRDGKPWDSKFANLFSYRVDDNAMYMRAGLLYTEKETVHEIAELMESGGTITSQGFMILPNYKGNSAFGFAHKTAAKIFHNLINAEELRMIFKNGNILYFDKVTKKLMFTGVKKINIKKQFDFEKAINSVRDKVVKKANTVLDKAVEDAEQHKRFSNLDTGN